MILVINSVGALTGSVLSLLDRRRRRQAAAAQVRQVRASSAPKDIEKTEEYFAQPRQGDDLHRPVPAGRPPPHLDPCRHRADAAVAVLRADLPRRHDLGRRPDGPRVRAGRHWETVANKVKRVDLVIGVVIVLAILALAIRFVLRRRRERAADEQRRLTDRRRAELLLSPSLPCRIQDVPPPNPPCACRPTATPSATVLASSGMAMSAQAAQAFAVSVLDRHETELVEQAMAAVASRSPADAEILQGLIDELQARPPSCSIASARSAGRPRSAASRATSRR